MGLRVRLPSDVKAFIEQEAVHNASSQNSEIVRCIREKMERITKEKGEAQA
ncbi:DNA-binding protein [Sinorhizobium meliloti]|nr:DNA-binding protein [Sinorhizobium meliloti]MDW9847229.1 DNA-binding protein [Sinorhizobium meliloti]MDX0147554.1 DNA-binding protein [Sinorhizobium meliloti]MDX0150057.1 DNA-binding protein [Sinorhizobium meliloti]MDX0169236.1 DNA-binding protein [Sinorhizobium meliloti]